VLPVASPVRPVKLSALDGPPPGVDSARAGEHLSAFFRRFSSGSDGAAEPVVMQMSTVLASERRVCTLTAQAAPPTRALDHPLFVLFVLGVWRRPCVLAVCVRLHASPPPPCSSQSLILTGLTSVGVPADQLTPAQLLARQSVEYFQIKQQIGEVFPRAAVPSPAPSLARPRRGTWHRSSVARRVSPPPLSHPVHFSALRRGLHTARGGDWLQGCQGVCRARLIRAALGSPLGSLPTRFCVATSAPTRRTDAAARAARRERIARRLGEGTAIDSDGRVGGAWRTGAIPEGDDCTDPATVDDLGGLSLGLSVDTSRGCPLLPPPPPTGGWGVCCGVLLLCV
jgi:hypothetical protein